MSDIKRIDPEYLRGLSDYADKQMSEALGDAADEIERLRAEIKTTHAEAFEMYKRLAEAEKLLSHAYKNPTWFESISLALEAEEYFNRWNNDS